MAGFVDGVVVDVPSIATRPASVLGVGHYVVARKPPSGGTGLPAPIGAGTPAPPGDLDAAPALNAYVAAWTRLTRWIAAAEAVALLDGSLSSGVLASVIETGTVAAAAERAGIDADRVRRISAALATHGLLDAAASHYRLAPEFDVLASRGARAALSSLLDPLMMRFKAR